MQIVIDIPEKTYKELKTVTVTHAGEQFAQKLIRYIIRGTPLPKGHGRLIDADRLECDYFNRTSDNYAFDCIDIAQTIIEADKTESKTEQ